MLIFNMNRFFREYTVLYWFTINLNYPFQNVLWNKHEMNATVINFENISLIFVYYRLFKVEHSDLESF